MKTTGIAVISLALTLSLAAGAAAAGTGEDALSDAYSGLKGRIKTGSEPRGERFNAIEVAQVPKAAGKAVVTEAAPPKRDGKDFAFPDLDGKTVKLSDFRGKIVLVDIWATWCPHCVHATPFLIRMHKKYASQGLVILSVDQGESKAEVEAFAGEMGVPYHELLDKDGDIRKVFPGRGIPDFKLIGPHGSVLAEFGGYSESMDDEFESAIRAAMPLIAKDKN